MTIKTDELSNLAGDKVVPMDTVVDGSAKAWVNFNGTGTVAIRAAFNISSITDNGVGLYSANFATDMPDTFYTIASTAGTEANQTRITSAPVTVPTVSSFSCNTANITGTNSDIGNIQLTIFR